MDTTYIADENHYSKVLESVLKTKKTLQIGSSDIKDLYFKKGRDTIPFLEVIASLVKKGVEVRLIHAKEPGVAFRTDFDKYPVLFTGLQRHLCPRVHFKLIIIDSKIAYIGSANLTGAGLGMKGEHTRNFEAGILTSDKKLVKDAITHFNSVWTGSNCKKCKRKDFCADPIV